MTLTTTRQVYADGLADGCEMTLRILCGVVSPEEEAAGGVGVAPQEHVGPELREWAQQALARLAGARKVLS